MQNHEDISMLVMREIRDLVYISDIETYELLYLNQSAIELIGNHEALQWKGKQCYKVLQNLDKPCVFCTNSRLNKNDFYCWDHYNQMLKRHFTIKDKLVEWDGRLVRLEIAIDNTEKEKIYRRLKKNLIIEQTLVTCIRTLSMSSDLNTAINELLETIGKYYLGDRAYIFECNFEKQLLVNTYEWCKHGVEPQIDNLKELPLSAADRWMDEFRKKGEFYISCLGENVDKNSAEYKILEPQGVQSLIAAPLQEGGQIIGFIGVDNPVVNTKEMILLQSVAFFVLDEIKRNKLTNQLKELSYIDTLTGVWNRNKYIEILNQFERVVPAKLGIIYVDINGLKRANDLHGHQYGDHLICRAAETLNEMFKDRVYRIGGDEFIILCTNISYSEFNKKVDRLYDAIRNDEECSLSIGLKWAEDGEDVNKQILTADKLMYADKQRYYSTREYARANKKIGLSKDLVKEIKEGRFVVYLQPQIEIRTGKLHGAEALIRRIGSQERLEAPIQFVPRYEAEGIIRYVDFFVFERVCQLLARWGKQGNSDLKISVNLSRFTLMEYRITEKLKKICKRYNIPESRIVIEVTETIGQMDREELKLLVQTLKETGFTVSLDDFGAEYSNLAILVVLNFNEVKLDKSLVDNIVKNNNAKIVTTHAIELCRDLEGIVSVAEGIETEGQLEILKNLQCDVGQGYLFDRPLPESEFEKKYVKTI